MDDPVSPEATMPDPASTALSAPRLALGDGAADYDAAVERARDGRVGQPAVRARRPPVVERPARRRGDRRAAGLARCARRISPSGSPASRGSATRSSTRATRRSSWPAWAAAASPRTSSAGRSARSRATSTCAILDSTDPAYVAATLDDLDPLRTLVDHRLEVGHDHRAERVPGLRLGARRGGARGRRRTTATSGPGAYFAAITDPGRSVEAIAHHDDFREVFLNPPDIGGRYSALTYVGLVPASLIGIDLDALLASASAMLGACREPDPARQPGRVARPRDRHAGQGRAATS